MTEALAPGRPVGEVDDAPGLFGFGLLVILGTIALSFRTPQRSS